MAASSLVVILSALLQSSLASIVFVDEHTTPTPKFTHTTPTPKFTRSEFECFKLGKILYEPESKCYKLLEAGPCRGDRQWLILDQEEVISGNGKLRSVCRQCPCCDKPYRAVHWPEDGQCHRLIRESKQLCPSPGTTLQIDPFGEGECACKKDPPHGRWSDNDNGPCYPLYRKGPCESGEIFIASSNNSKCTRDPCFQYNQRNSSEIFVEWEDGDAKCYTLGSRGPCQGESTTFDIHPVTRRPGCISRVNQIVDLPPICDTDQNGDCITEIELPPDDEYLTNLLTAAQKRRSKRRTNIKKKQT